MSLATFTWLLSNKWIGMGCNGNELFFFGISDCIDLRIPLHNQDHMLRNMWVSSFVEKRKEDS